VPHIFINFKVAATQRPNVGRFAPAPPSIMTKLQYCDITRRLDIMTEQERSLSITMRPCPSHAIRKDKSIRTAAFQARKY